MQGNNQQAEDKREYLRESILAFIELRQIVNKGYSFFGKIYNLSPKGMYIQTDAPLALGELFRAEIVQSSELPEGESMIGAAVWSHTLQDANSGRFGFGVQYFRAPPSALLLTTVSPRTHVALPAGLGQADGDELEELDMPAV